MTETVIIVAMALLLLWWGYRTEKPRPEPHIRSVPLDSFGDPDPRDEVIEDALAGRLR